MRTLKLDPRLTALSAWMPEMSKAKALGSGVQFIREAPPPLRVAWYVENGLTVVSGAGEVLPTGTGTEGGERPEEDEEAIEIC